MITDAIKEQCVLESADYFLVKHPDRVKELGEVFTPTHLVLEILEQLPDTVWEPLKTYLDPTCGNGQFLASVLIIKMALGHVDALSTIYGVDFMQDNVDECRQRLLDIAGDTVANRKTVMHNIRREDGLTYDYCFKTIEEEQKFFAGKLEPTKKVKKVKIVDTPRELPSNLF